MSSRVSTFHPVLSHVLVAAACAALFATPGRTYAQTDLPATTAAPLQHTIIVSGTGEVKAAPDKVDVTLSVVTEGKTSQEAAARNAQIATQIKQAVEGKGITAEEIQTSGYLIEPISTESAPGRPSRITGYRVSNSIDVTVLRPDTVGDVIDAATAAGANSVDGLNWGLQNRDAAQDLALERAVQNARRRADAICKAAGLSISGIYSIRSGGAGPAPVFAGGTLAAAPMARTPVSPGLLTVTEVVSVIYALRDQRTAPAAK